MIDSNSQTDMLIAADPKSTKQLNQEQLSMEEGEEQDLVPKNGDHKEALEEGGLPVAVSDDIGIDENQIVIAPLDSSHGKNAAGGGGFINR